MPRWMSSLPFVLALATAAQGAEDVVIRNLDKPGSFEVENTGPEISLRSRVEIQKQRQGLWTAVASNVRLEENCTEAPQPECRVLKSGAKVRPMPFDGYTCNANCPPGCKGNAYLGPGDFRIVIFSCDGARKFTGPVFRLGKR